MTLSKEIKLPKFSKDMDFDDYEIKLMHAAKTKGEIHKVFKGDYMNLMPQYDTVNGQTVRHPFTADQLKYE